MSRLLDRLLWEHSPLVVGYSGWADDVIMTALERRLKSELPFKLYWFCYRREDRDKLPEWLKVHRDVRFVVPERVPSEPAGFEAGFAAREVAGISGHGAAEPNLPATRVFEKLIDAFKVETPLLLRDPMEYLAHHLENSLPLRGSRAEPDRYALRAVIGRVRRARECLEDRPESFERQMEALRDAVRRADYRAAVEAASRLHPEDFQGRLEQAREYLSALRAAASALEDPEDRLQACGKLIEVADRLFEHGQRDSALERDLAWALFNKGVSLGDLHRSEEAIAVYDEVVRRFDAAAEPGLREWVAKALFIKGATLGQLGRSEEAIAVYDEVVRRFGAAAEPGLREPVAWALFNKGVRLGQLGRSEEAIAVYDEVVRRFGEAAEPGLREIASLAAWKAADSVTRSAKRVWREGQGPEARRLLSDASERLSLAPAGGGARIPALAGYTAFLLDEEYEATARISEALRLNSEEARAYLRELAGFEALPKDKQLESWLETLDG